ncbi:MAG: hypothetical protein AMQ22_01075 [Candidatus Methanofastidiosum methylothiophilum]|uniref:Uncharacterized protein n=1 Tax=Candidatus Methanofastidiosum methylothiophilum TaxID=1705564 RepID=A0A150J3Z6_9EURY|nr:MAG: hypothetical protein AMQ22_01075 [Candidatus Methanofastidiosum methylthiophilus]
MLASEITPEKVRDPQNKILPHWSVVNIAKATGQSVISFFGDTIKSVGYGRTSMSIAHRFNKGENFILQGIGRIFVPGILYADWNLLMSKHPFITLKIGNEEMLNYPLNLVKDILSVDGAAGAYVRENVGDWTKIPNAIEIPDETEFSIDMNAGDGDFSTLTPTGGIYMGVVMFGQGRRRK